MIISAQEPALPLYLQSTYNFDVSKIVLVYIAAIVPSFICEHLAASCPPTGMNRAHILKP